MTVDPDFWTGYHQLAQVHEQRGEKDAALTAADTASTLSGGNSKAVSLRAYILGITGRDEEARSMVTALEQTATSRYVPPYAIALVYLGLQRADAMFQWLERAYDARDVHLVFAPVDPKWDPLRGERRFQDVMSRCGFTSTPALHAIGSGLLLEPPCEAYELTLPGHMCTAGGVRADLVSADLSRTG